MLGVVLGRQLSGDKALLNGYELQPLAFEPGDDRRAYRREGVGTVAALPVEPSPSDASKDAAEAKSRQEHLPVR